MNLVEFLDFVGRIAVLKFKDTEMEDLPLHQKIAFILDDIFAVVGLTRNDVFREEEASESDSDY